MKPPRSIAHACVLLLLGAAGAAVGAPLDRAGIQARFKDVTQMEQGTADRLAPELEKQAGEIEAVMKKYKARSADVLPELQADLDRVGASLSQVGDNLTDEKLQAKWGAFQAGLMKDMQEGAIEEISAGLFAQLKLDQAQIKQVQPVFKDHLGKLLGVVKEGQVAGLDGVPALATALRQQFADFDARLRDLLRPEQLAEVNKIRTDLKDKLFGQVSDAQVAKLIAMTEGKVVDTAELRKLLEQDMKAKVDLAKDVTETGKEAADKVKAGLDAINGNTRSNLKRLVPGRELDVMDAARRTSDVKLLRRIGK